MQVQVCERAVEGKDSGRKRSKRRIKRRREQKQKQDQQDKLIELGWATSASKRDPMPYSPFPETLTLFLKAETVSPRLWALNNFP